VGTLARLLRRFGSAAGAAVPYLLEGLSSALKMNRWEYREETPVEVVAALRDISPASLGEAARLAADALTRAQSADDRMRALTVLGLFGPEGSPAITAVTAELCRDDDQDRDDREVRLRSEDEAVLTKSARVLGSIGGV